MKGFGWVLLVLLAGGGAIVASVSVSRPGVPATSAALAAPPIAQPAPSKGDPECLARWLKAEKGGITRGEGMVDGHMEVMVDEATYGNIDYNTKVGMAETFQCAVVGKGNSLAEVLFVSNMTGKVLATWSWGKLTVN